MGVEMSNSIRFGSYGGWVNRLSCMPNVWLVMDSARVVCGFDDLIDAMDFCNYLNGGPRPEARVILGWYEKIHFSGPAQSIINEE